MMKSSMEEDISKKKKKKSSTDGHLSAAVAETTLLPPWRTRSSIYESLTQYPSPYVYNLHASLFSPSSYDIVFCVHNYHPIETRHWNWYSITIDADGGPNKAYQKPLIPFWKGTIPACGSVAALGSHIYCFGGTSKPHKGIRDVYKLRVTPRIAKEWVPVSPMISPRYCMEASVIGGKLYVSNSFSYHEKSFAPWGEVFDPTNEKWEGVPNPPIHPSKYENRIIIYAALENPDRIIVAYSVHNDESCAIFYAYNVQHKYWRNLTPTKRKLHPMCHDMTEDYWLQNCVSVNNTLYWIEHGMKVKDDLLFIAYNLDLDMWLEGCLNGFGRFFFQDYSMWNDERGHRPDFIHLEKQRFCVLQRSDDYGYLRYLLIEISPMLDEKTLGISVVWDHEFEMESERFSRLSFSFVRPNKEVRFLDERKENYENRLAREDRYKLRN